MASKIYAIDGKTTVSLLFGLGKAKPFRAEFVGGRPDLDGKHPATYIAKSVGQEIAIEHSPAFHSGEVYLYRDLSKAVPAGRSARTIQMGAVPVEETGQITEQVAPAYEPSGEMEEREDITTREDAVALLKSLGVKATALRSNEGILRSAAQRNISFPNLSL